MPDLPHAPPAPPSPSAQVARDAADYQPYVPPPSTVPMAIMVPLTLLALMGGWFGYRSADEASTQHDQRLLRLLPALADSVLAPSIAEGTPPLVALTPAIEDVLRQRHMQLARLTDQPDLRLNHRLDSCPEQLLL